ncbi:MULTISPECIES: glutathione S-transferase C-terminal domain-containing protein [Streptacidiphilus]|uniref:Glutathione S-transferase C-terminal domain-containing protein n=1 Tax=Streptacidiphilus cavernicola TaxID=3342716 RepID=A0ABV6UML6_9ACTN|nr:glutathione S-transferase C-terminal domain-containing protein [Streptacidiphilus jeojiense]
MTEHQLVDAGACEAQPESCAPAGAAPAREVEKLRGRITADGSSGYPAEPGRYHVYVSWGCSWSSRAAVVRRLKGLEEVVSLSYVDDSTDERGWIFGGASGPDPVNGFSRLREAYEATVPHWPGRASVPALWDRVTGRLVSNESGGISLDLSTQFDAWSSTGADLYPEPLRPRIDAFNAWLHHDINNGLHRVGHQADPVEHARFFTILFDRFDELERRLTGSRYLFGAEVTEPDVRLWLSLVRLDTAYPGLLATSLDRPEGFPALWAYARDLYRLPAFRETTNFAVIRQNFADNFDQLHPERVVPAQSLQSWTESQWEIAG